MTIPGHTLDHIAFYSPGMLFCGDTLFSAGCGRLFEGEAIQLYSSLQRMAALPAETQIYCAHEYTLNNLRFAKVVEPDNIAIDQRIVSVTELRQKNQPSLPSTLAIEKSTNPFLRCHSPTIIKNVSAYAGHTLSSELDVFTWLRKYKDHFTA
jgi:hydroxyacylglutathione hydrolase